ncbi:unnamed protein product [Polarella glacialis]|uniref:Protein kinase domain-containing protein n=1 Tax=Polarella glacialis TaxID=89957 RepID=A0A813HQR3_POLGL|nr:unnamed protein product [Polarella glacialis]
MMDDLQYHAWLHPLHYAQQEELGGCLFEGSPPTAWQGGGRGQSRLEALEHLTRRVAHCAQPATTALPEREEAAAAEGGLKLLRAQGEGCFVVAGEHDLLVYTRGAVDDVSTATCCGECQLKVPLLHSDVFWSSVPAVRTEAGSSGPLVAHHIVAVAPRSEEVVHSLLEPCLSKVWLLCLRESAVPNYNDNNSNKNENHNNSNNNDNNNDNNKVGLHQFLFQLGKREAIRWDLHSCYELPEGIRFDSQGFAQVCALSREQTPGPEEVEIELAKAGAGQAVDKALNNIRFLSMFSGHPNIVSLLGVYCFHDEQEYVEDDFPPMVSRNLSPDSVRSLSSITPQTALQLCFGGTYHWATVREQCPLGNLGDIVSGCGVLSDMGAVEVMSGVLSALTCLHEKKVVHRNLNPWCILMGSNAQAVLADFRWATNIQDSLAMQKHIGTQGFVAPEVIERAPYGLTVDTFAAGAVFYFLLTAKAPCAEEFDIDSGIPQTGECRIDFATVFQLVSSAVKVLLGVLMSKEPHARPSTRRSFEQCWSLLPPESKRRAQPSHQAFSGLRHNLLQQEEREQRLAGGKQHQQQQQQQKQQQQQQQKQQQKQQQQQQQQKQQQQQQPQDNSSSAPWVPKVWRSTRSSAKANSNHNNNSNNNNNNSSNNNNKNNNKNNNNNSNNSNSNNNSKNKTTAASAAATSVSPPLLPTPPKSERSPSAGRFWQGATAAGRRLDCAVVKCLSRPNK